MDKFLRPVEKLLDNALSNIYINTSLKVFLGLYAALAAPRLPKMIADLFENTLFRIFVAFVIVLLATKDEGLALMVAIAFIVSLFAINKNQLLATELSTSLPDELSWLPSAKSQERMTEEVITQPIENFGAVSELLSNTSPEIIPNSDQQSCIKTWNNEMCIQGIEKVGPTGYDPLDDKASF
jgi:hypothetical protein